MPSESTNELIAKIYEAPLRLAAWGEVVGAVAEHFSAAAGGQFHIFDAQRRCMLFSSVPAWVSPEADRTYNAHYAATDPRRALVDTTACGEWVFDQEHFDRSFVSRSEIFQFLRRFDVRYAAATKISSSPEALAVFAIFKGVRQKPFDEQEKRQLRALSPHLLQSATLTVHLRALRAQLDQRDTALDGLDDAIVVVDGRLRLVFGNRAGETLLSDRHFLYTRHGRVCALTARDADALSASIRDALTRGAGSTILLTNTATGGKIPCRVLPLPQNPLFSGLPPQPLALLVLPSGNRQPHRVRSIAALYGFTPAEQRVAELLLSGKSAASIARQLGRSVNTVRTQLRQLLEKTGCHRQAELVALLST